MSSVRTDKAQERFSLTLEKQVTASQGSPERQNQEDIDTEGDLF